MSGPGTTDESSQKSRPSSPPEEICKDSKGSEKPLVSPSRPVTTVRETVVVGVSVLRINGIGPISSQIATATTTVTSVTTDRGVKGVSLHICETILEMGVAKGFGSGVGGRCPC